MNLNDMRLNAYKNSLSSFSSADNSGQTDSVSGGLLKVLLSEKRPEGKKKDSVYRRVAKFLMIIGVDRSAEVLQHLAPEQIEKIVPELAAVRSVSPEEKEVILAEFEGLVNQTSELGGKQTAFTILEKAYGADKAEQMISKAAPYAGKKPFDYLKDCDTEKILLLLHDESAGIQALVLSHLEPEKAAQVINRMSGEMKKDVVRHLANLSSVNPEFLNRVDNAMHEKASRSVSEKSDRVDGRNALAEILKKMSPSAEKNIISSLAEEDSELAGDLKKRLFTEEDVLNADERFIQEYLNGKSDLEVVFLIAGKSADLRKKILSCVSKGRRVQILDEEQVSSPVSAKDSENETSRFVSALRSAYEKGHLVIKGRNDGEYVS